MARQASHDPWCVLCREALTFDLSSYDRCCLGPDEPAFDADTVIKRASESACFETRIKSPNDGLNASETVSELLLGVFLRRGSDPNCQWKCRRGGFESLPKLTRV